jgi:type IV pilus assembly protein PilE
MTTSRVMNRLFTSIRTASASSIIRVRRAALDDGGWSLSELLIVLVIIGILALIALPRFASVTTRAKTTEAQGMLRYLHTLQQSYHYQHDRYAESLDAIGFDQVPLVTDGGTARYRIDIESAGLSDYVATATSVVDFSRNGRFNVWEVDETGRISQRVAD